MDSIAADTTGTTQDAGNGDAMSVTTMSDETLARAILTYCADGPNALMFATLKGTQSARLLLALLSHTVVAEPPDWLCPPRTVPSTSDERTATPVNPREDGALEHLFIVGASRWGRAVDAASVERFRLAVERWRQRLTGRPLADPDALRRIITADYGQWVISPDSPYWPRQLNDLDVRSDWAPPLCLWGMGDIATLISCSAPIAIVGSRDANDYGSYVARNIALQAARQGHLVISGGAMGADTAAHRGALAALGGSPGNETDSHGIGRTIAVFAGGLDHRGPRRNMRLFDDIIVSGGVLISEMPPGTIPEARRFLSRNRIIAALADTVVIAQARLRSGALNTASWAAEMHRSLYAAPGNVNEPFNAGCNALIQDGKATLLTSATDIAGICHDAHEPFSINSGDVSAGERAAIAAIRSCHRKNIPATPQNMLVYLDRCHFSLGIDATTLTGLIGTLETRGLIAVNGDGTCRTVPIRKASGTQPPDAAPSRTASSRNTCRRQPTLPLHTGAGHRR